jgi:hypothetical protein
LEDILRTIKEMIKKVIFAIFFAVILVIIPVSFQIRSVRPKIPESWPTTGDTIASSRAAVEAGGGADSMYILGVKLYYDDASTKKEGLDFIRRSASLDNPMAQKWLFEYEMGKKSFR